MLIKYCKYRIVATFLKIHTFCVNFATWVDVVTNRDGTDFGIGHHNNRLNPKMNNLMAIDYALKDWIGDCDGIVGRYHQEFP